MARKEYLTPAAKQFLRDYLVRTRKLVPAAANTPGVSDVLVGALCDLAEVIEVKFFKNVYEGIPGLSEESVWHLSNHNGEPMIVIEEKAEKAEEEKPEKKNEESNKTGESFFGRGFSLN